MKSTSFSSRLVSKPAKSPGLSSTGPDVIFRFTPSSLAIMFASVVFPNPGGPWSRTWSSDSPRIFAAATKIFRFSTTFCCPEKSSNVSGRSCFSNSLSLFEICSGSRFVFILTMDTNTFYPFNALAPLTISFNSLVIAA